MKATAIGIGCIRVVSTAQLPEPIRHDSEAFRSKLAPGLLDQTTDHEPSQARPDTIHPEKNLASLPADETPAKELPYPGVFCRPDFLDPLYPLASRKEPIVDAGQRQTDFGRHLLRRDPGFAASLDQADD